MIYVLVKNRVYKEISNRISCLKRTSAGKLPGTCFFCRNNKNTEKSYIDS